MDDNTIYDICIKTAMSVNRRYNLAFDVKDLASVGFIAIKTSSVYDNISAKAYLYQLQYAHTQCKDSKRHTDHIEYHEDCCKRCETRQSDIDLKLDMINAFEYLNDEEKLLIISVFFEHKPYKDLLEVLHKNNISSVKLKLDKALDKLKSHMKGYK